jgi:hypothetical protein
LGSRSVLLDDAVQRLVEVMALYGGSGRLARGGPPMHGLQRSREVIDLAAGEDELAPTRGD